ncbi:ABC transporter substrate-binding protein [Phytoactinopolyspora halotolerans]|uniref:ABC transporter substrate-binding protein n=1 Tax=Phytoactinopolyspora halotolerans TaxID=1981512 RepID=A0A6L9SF97_9ACTN|nr:ABC transporter substrate-binding protein [Phytoactinopolyspora halotolerans]NEE02720.1 ABC transporter substrate-binding protein [Phytoactinopolyspora halotolerans]
MTRSLPSRPVVPRPLSRRGFLWGTFGLAAAGAAGGVLTGCSSDSTADAGTDPSATPSAGGRLRLGAAGAATETLNVLTATAITDYISIHALHDPMVSLAGDDIELRLAESIEPNADATEFTIRLRPDVTFHDGRPCTADDVRYSLAALADPEQSPNFSQYYADLDAANLTVVDARTLRLPLHRPRADFVEGGLATFSFVFPDGTSGDQWESGIGTGPFRLASGTGDGRLLERNPDYWDGTAMLDEVDIVAIADAETRLNALRGGEIDYAHAVSAAGAAGVENDAALTIVRGGAANSQALTFEMNTGLPPFDDPDVRLAMKLLVDRQALIDTVLFGQGVVGNDIVGHDLVGFNSDLAQREHDVERARALLSGAGVSEVTLRVAELAPGLTDAADLLVEQAAEAGLTVTVESADPATYFADFETLMSTPFQAIPWVNRPAATHIAAFTGSAGGFNVTGVGGEEYDGLLTRMQATVDPDDRQAALDEIQAYLWEHGGDLVWGYAEQLDAVAAGVDGLRYSQSIPLLDQVTMA